jgi:AhpD family alkylhydroperoxidase
MSVLSKKQEALLDMAVSISTCNMDKLRPALDAGFDAGLTANEAREVAVQLYAYCGFPRALNALNTIAQVLLRRKESGKDTEQGRTNGAIPAEQTSYRLGSRVQRALFDMPAAAPLDRDASSEEIINYYLRAHLFGDIFARDLLDWKTREFVTVSALSVMPGCEAQLSAHIAAAKRQGNSEDEIKAILARRPQR